jgi:2-isopropylmalate synthase
MDIQKAAPSLKNVTMSAHCHDDLGLGVANSLAAIKAGANQVETTINGIGERAGNSAMEEIVMNLAVRKDMYEAETNIDSKQLAPASKMLTSITGIKVPPNKAIVGENAFAHESGIHQHGMLNNKLTYEIMTPSSVGAGDTNLVLGKHSGKHAFSSKLKKMGIDISEKELETSFEKFKALADKKKKISDSDILAIVSKEQVQVPKVYALDSFVINTGNLMTSTATVKLVKKNKKIEEVASGDGPINAAYKAIDKIVGHKISLEDYKLDSVTEGEDALGEAFAVIKDSKGKIFSGRGLSTDVIEASIFAYVNAINKMLY